MNNSILKNRDEIIREMYELTNYRKTYTTDNYTGYRLDWSRADLDFACRLYTQLLTELSEIADLYDITNTEFGSALKTGYCDDIIDVFFNNIRMFDEAPESAYQNFIQYGQDICEYFYNNFRQPEQNRYLNIENLFSDFAEAFTFCMFGVRDTSGAEPVVSLDSSRAFDFASIA